MNGRRGTSADVIMHARAIDAILSVADSSKSDDVRVGVYLGGSASIDDVGRFYEVMDLQSSADGAVGMALTSEDEVIEPSEVDVASLRRTIGEGVLMIVDPYACRFTISVVDRNGVRRADAVVLE
ncbi:MAG: hypothetical protein ACI38Y_05510 [Candidatus Methanomethylophilaceae archaeon]